MPELVRAICFMISAEYEAIQLYQQVAESTDHPLAKEVLNDIADEENHESGSDLDVFYSYGPFSADRRAFQSPAHVHFG
ncbi:MAG: hypothetical protein AB2L11_04535 [Syntrophobacteraceae bacterium]